MKIINISPSRRLPGVEEEGEEEEGVEEEEGTYSFLRVSGTPATVLPETESRSQLMPETIEPRHFG